MYLGSIVTEIYHNNFTDIIFYSTILRNCLIEINNWRPEN